MRILSISSENIASLAQPFAIDFTAAPLAGAGLFVITGVTGAGKSSILNAMCLALYGDAPRLAGSTGDETKCRTRPAKPSRRAFPVPSCVGAQRKAGRFAGLPSIRRMPTPHWPNSPPASARMAAEDARNKQAEALRAQDRAEAELEQAKTNAQTAEAKISTAQAHWQDSYNRAMPAPHCPALTQRIGEDPTKLDTLLTAINTAQQAEVAAQVELARLRQTQAATTTRREDLRKIIAGHATARENLNSELAEAQTTRHRTVLSPILEQLGETLSDPGLSDRLENRVMKIAELRKCHNITSALLIALAPRIAKAESRAESTAKHFQAAQEAVTTRLNALQTLQSERAPLLGGEATATHRTRHNEARKAGARNRIGHNRR